MSAATLVVFVMSSVTCGLGSTGSASGSGSGSGCASCTLPSALDGMSSPPAVSSRLLNCSSVLPAGEYSPARGTMRLSQSAGRAPRSACRRRARRTQPRRRCACTAGSTTPTTTASAIPALARPLATPVRTVSAWGNSLIQQASCRRVLPSCRSSASGGGVSHARPPEAPVPACVRARMRSDDRICSRSFR